MRIAILGTGRVAQTLAAGLYAPATTSSSARAIRTPHGLPAPVVSSADAVVGADVVIDAVQGVDTIPLLSSIGADKLNGTVLWDMANAANPDFSLAIPDDSLVAASRRPSRTSRSSRRATTSPPSSSPTPARCPRRRRCSSRATTPAPRTSSRPARRSGLAAREPVRPGRHHQRLRTGALPRPVRNDAAATRHALLQHRRRQGGVSGRGRAGQATGRTTACATSTCATIAESNVPSSSCRSGGAASIPPRLSLTGR